MCSFKNKKFHFLVTNSKNEKTKSLFQIIVTRAFFIEMKYVIIIIIIIIIMIMIIIIISVVQT